MIITVVKSHKIIVTKGASISQTMLPGVSIITCTNRTKFIERVFDNYMRQTYQPRELIVILNSNSMSLGQWKIRAAAYPNISVFQLDERKTQGECLNYAVAKSKYDYIAKFDDDDYYAPAFLENMMPTFGYVDAGIIGKWTCYFYFESSKTLALFSPGHENCYVERVHGASMVIKKDVFNTVRFRNINAGEDLEFCRDCRLKDILTYSTDQYNFVAIRRPDVRTHSWQDEEEVILSSYCQIISQTDDYITPITR